MNLRDFLIQRIDSARLWTTRLIADVDDSEYFQQPKPDMANVAWSIGHIAVSQWYLIGVRLFSKSPLEDRLAKLYARGSTPSGDASIQPSPAELRQLHTDLHRDCVALLKTLSESDLEKPVAGDPHPFFKTWADLLTTVAAHEAFHAGQIALIRRMMGKAALR